MYIPLSIDLDLDLMIHREKKLKVVRRNVDVCCRLT